MDPRLSRSHSDHDRTKPQSPNRGDPRLRTQEPPQPQQPPHWPHPLAQMPQTHYTIGDGLTTYQHLVPSAATAIYPPAAPPGPYAQYPGYAAPTAYQAYPAYAAYYTPAPPPQHIEQQQHATSYQQPPQMPGTYAPQGAPQGSWAPARMSEQVPVQVQTPITAYMQQQQQQAASTATVPPSSDIAATTKQEGVEQEMQQTQAEMRRQRDDFDRRAALLSRELEQLKKQKRELKQQLQQQNGDTGTPSKDRETVSILKDNTKLQMEIQSKLKELANRVDLLSGILGDRKTKSSHRSSSSGKERERSKHNRERERSSSEHRSGRTRNSRDRERSSRDKSAGGDSTSSSSGSSQSDGANNTTANSSTQHQLPDMTATVQYNYVHYDPEVHWCRICDAFPRTAKDLLQHLHDDDHRQLMQAENIEIPWHKLPSQDKEFPFREGATKRRVPIKGLQFFVSAPAWYCRLCDTWIGDLHCASQHLKSIGHTQNYANFVDQNPKWEKEWLEDRKKALERCSSNVVSDKKANPALDLAIEQKTKTLTSMSSMQFDKKKTKKSKKSKKNKSSTKKGKKRRNSKKLSDDSSGTSTSTSTTSSSDDSSSDENDDGVDKSKSIRVAMRNQVMKSSSAMMDEQIMILENLVKEKKRLQQQEFEIHAEVQSRAAGASSDSLKQNNTDDRLISQWMNVDQAGNKLSADGSIEEKKDKYLLDSLKDRLKQKQDKEQRARLFQQQQQQMEEEQARRKEREEAEGKQREEMEERERREREAREGMTVNSSSREQVKFRQFRGGKATTAQRRRSNEASPTTSSSPKNNRSSHRSRSRSSSSERRRGRGRGERDRRYSHQKHGGYRGRRSSRSRSRTTSPPRSNTSSKGKNEVIKDKEDLEKEKKHVPATPGVPQRKLPFIGRMPLFKNRKLAEDQQTKTSTTKTDNQQQQDLLAEASGDAYEMPRQSRFQPGNLARAFIPQPDVVHYPKLTTQPVVQLPPTPLVLPDPPRISVPQPPPPPNIQPTPKPIVEQYQHAELKQHQQVYEYTEAEFDGPNQQHHEMEHDTLPPLPPSMLMPPLPPPPPKLQYGLERGKGGEDFDDLAMLGISSDDMAAQVF